MARRNYDQMYNMGYSEAKKPEVLVSEEQEEKKEETKIEKKTSFIGTVIGGKSLNVREKPNGTVINSLPDGSQITITNDSDPEWYKIEPEGYVMKKFVKKDD